MGEVVFSSSGDLTRAKSAERQSRVANFLTTAAEGLFATLFPSDCRLCGAPLIRIARVPVCEQCLDQVRPIAQTVCELCGEVLPGPYTLAGDDGSVRCGLCRRLEPAFERVAAYGSYESGLRELIHLLKYEGMRPVANLLGRMLGEVIADLSPCFEGESVLVVPVPLHSTKSRQRGFNQAELIVRAALKHPSARHDFEIAANVLQRWRYTETQTGLSRHQRHENIRGAFKVLQPERVLGREALLVDDVFTTGTTVSECARILRRAGAVRVVVATVARVLKGEAAGALAEEDVEREPLAMAARV
ncbi:MAG TPA: ComF family protein [Terriglobales bacterium]|nr:ComF family protein [Terriglobales bacterium]